MPDGGLLILSGSEVRSLLQGREFEMIAAVRAAYIGHGSGQTSLPHSTFLHFPGRPRDRIIALPAYLGGESPIAGIKWISSFPDNVARGLDRASGVIVLSSTETGLPIAVLEGSVVSALRTAASAALAAQVLLAGPAPREVAIIGCGLINSVVVAFLARLYPPLSRLLLFDTNPALARHFAATFTQRGYRFEVTYCPSAEAAIQEARLISIATTSTIPHILSLGCRPESTVLHISLRDLAPELILSCDNVVDDEDHVCRAQTSIHLAQQLTSSKNFIRPIHDILTGRTAARTNETRPVVFSPFGLGILDLAIARMALAKAVTEGRGAFFPGFAPDAWSRAEAAGLAGPAARPEMEAGHV